MLTLRRLAISAPLFAMAACSDGNGPAPIPTSVCSESSVKNLAVGAHTVIDAASEGSCVRIPAAGAGGAEYLYVALATDGIETDDGTMTSYHFEGGAAGTVLDVAPATPNPLLKAFQPPTSPAVFHRQLRERERELARTAGAAFRRGARADAVAAPIVPPPAEGHQRDFFVCADAICRQSEMVQTTGTAKYVGTHVVIYVDNGAPSEANGGYQAADLQRFGSLFDTQLYSIATTAFGSESDIDDNGRVVVLLSQRVNTLGGVCNGSFVLGYFFGLDLQPAEPKSNDGEIFYGLVPGTLPTCSVTRQYANTNIPSTFIHEFQHMISFNQHVLEGGAALSEDVWLNEGLSHFAEELGGMRITNPSLCEPIGCFSQFAAGSFVNAYNYLTNPEATFLVAPGESSGSLEERGAGWLFVRWLVDHFGTDQFGTNVTRALVGTTRRGGANVEFVTQQSFSLLASQWQLANYLDDLPSFAATSDRLSYPGLLLRLNFNSFHQQDDNEFPTPYPLVPDEVTSAGYTRIGELRAGSGRHLRIIQSANDAAIDLRLTANDGVSVPPAAVKPRIALVRIR